MYIRVPMVSEWGTETKTPRAKYPVYDTKKAKQANLWVELVRNTHNSRQLVAFGYGLR
jgi:hypothetical protein